MIIDFGAGPHPSTDADIFVDCYKWRDDYKILDLTSTPYDFESNFADKIYFFDVIEHITIFEIPRVLSEFNRILKKDGELIITTPDLDWIAERIFKKDWNISAPAGWLNKHNDNNMNALSYLFGGFCDEKEFNIKGMGHVCCYNFTLLEKYLKLNRFQKITRIDDMRNDPLTRKSILKVICQPKK